MVPWVLNSILSKYIRSQNPHVRQAACIWLLSLVKKLCQHKEITVGTLKLMLEFNGVFSLFKMDICTYSLCDAHVIHIFTLLLFFFYSFFTFCGTIKY